MPHTFRFLHLCATALLVLFAAPACMAEGPWRPFAELDLQADAGPVSIAAALDDWRGALAGGRHQQTDNTLRLGIAQEGQGYALFWRHAQSLEFSEDTARLYHAQRNDTTLSAGDTYPLALAATRFAALGFSASRTLWRSPRTNFGATLSGFQASELLDGVIHGTATVIDAESFRYDTRVDYRYDEDVLFGRKVRAPDGIGASLDIDAAWQAAPGIRAHLQIRDAAGAIHWRDVPVTVASASSSRTWTDQAGNPVTGPAVSGREALLRGWSQRLPATGTLTLAADVTRGFTVAAQVEQQLAARRLGWLFTWRAGNALQWHAAWYPQQRGGGIGFSVPLLFLHGSGDALDHDSANWQHLQLRAGAAGDGWPAAGENRGPLAR